MVKYEIWKDTYETKRNGRIWSVDDMKDVYSSNDTDVQIVASFDTLEEAEEFFKNEQNNCTSRYQDGYSYELLIFDYLELQKNEYEDDELQDVEILDTFIARIEHSIDDLFDDVLDYASYKMKCSAKEADDINFVNEKVRTYIDENYDYLCDSDREELCENVCDAYFD